ncbi:MarR family winged helix-turn-helix transcriptional regulator [Salinicoccus halodurans]|uniref:MarR family winged helix-turn-helix transcriptional regulator n=1 Tax=Salinicoccus halodurans TaxID=407035 RepID=UPI0009F33837|nr:MarR family transcriptional regulator [Salinicoccus halodurans]
MVNDKSLEKLELEIAMMVRGLRNRATEVDEKQKLRRASYFIMLIISDKGPMGVKDMADQLHLDVSTVSRQAGDLLKKEFLKKTPSETDRRSYTYEITEKGWEALASNREGRQDRFRTMIEQWETGEIEEFARLLKKFNSLLESD